MNWRHPEMERWALPSLPARWLWLAVPVMCIAVAAVVLFFTWPVQRGFANPRFWLYQLLLPFIVALAINAFILSAAFQARREIAWRHLFIDNKRAQWQRWGRQSLTLTGYHCLTPEPDIGPRMLGLEQPFPQAPSAPLRLALTQDDALDFSPYADILIQTLAPLSALLKTQPLPDIWLSVNVEEEDARLVLEQYWQNTLNKRLPAEHIHWQAEVPDMALLSAWCDEAIARPRLVLCTHLHEDATAASEFSVALLFQPKEQVPSQPAAYLPVKVFRPLVTPAHQVENHLPRLLAVGQTDTKRLSHLWLCGLARREQGAVFSFLDEQGISLPAQHRHDMALSLGPQIPSSAWLALALAAQACDLGQRGQLVVTQHLDTLSALQVTTQPAPAVDAPRDRLSRYPTAYLGGIFAALLALILLPTDPAIQITMLPWLAGGFLAVAALLSFSIPLALHLWRKQLDVEWHLLEEKRHD